MGAAEEYLTRSPAETEAVARQFAASLQPGEIVAYRGPMGAGKTAFTRGVASYFGLEDQVSSPTFALVNEYRGGGVKLFHFDLYRVSGWEGLYSIGFFDYLDQGAILLVEWSENAAGAIEEPVTLVTLEILDETTRRITVRRRVLLTEEGIQ